MGRVGRNTHIREPSGASSSEGTGPISKALLHGLPEPAYFSKDSVFKPSYKGSLFIQIRGTEFIQGSQQSVLLQACPSSVKFSPV